MKWVAPVVSRVVGLLRQLKPRTRVKATWKRLNRLRLSAKRIFHGYLRPSLPEGINLIGFFKAQIGLGEGVRLYASALKKTGIPHTLVNIDCGNVKEQPEDRYEHELSPAPRFRVNLVHINPAEFSWVYDSLFALRRGADSWFRHYNIGVFLWELEDVPVQWSDVFPYFHEIWTPSSFTCAALRKTAGIPVRIVPYGIEAFVEPGTTRATFGLPQNTFLALMMYDCHSVAERKNPAGAIEAFLSAFGDDPKADVSLVIKMNNATDSDIASVHALAGGDRRIQLITELMPRKRVNTLISLCDTYLSLHRGEGFGLTLAEAMALGVPVIATAYSANMDFMDEQIACLVRYTLIPVGEAYPNAPAGALWADPDIGQAAGYLRHLYEQPAARREMASLAQERLKKEYSVMQSSLSLRQQYENSLHTCRRTDRRHRSRTRLSCKRDDL